MFAPRGWLQGRGNQAVYRALAQSSFFDKKWYRESNMSGVTGLTDPLWHFIRQGWLQGLDPSPRFDTKFYLWWNKDVRESKVNPLDHFVNYGEAEGRPALKPLAQWWPSGLEAVSPVKFFLAPSAGKKRLSVVIDVNTPNRWKGDLALNVLVAAWLSHSLGRELRILLRSESPELPHIDPDLFHWPATVPSPQVTRVPVGIEYSDIARYEDEIFMATSWSSAHSLYGSLSGEKVIYLVARDEIKALPSGEARDLARAAMGLEGVKYLVPSHVEPKKLWPEKESLKAVFHEKSVNLGFFVKKSMNQGNHTPSVVIWAGDNPTTSNARTILSSLESVVSQKKIDPDKNPVALAGETAERLLLLGTYPVSALHPQTVEEEITLISTSSVIVAFGATETSHPVADSARTLGAKAFSDRDVSDSMGIGDLIVEALDEKKKQQPKITSSPATKILELSERLGKHFA